MGHRLLIAFQGSPAAKPFLALEKNHQKHHDAATPIGWLGLWLLLCAWLGLTGWILSALRFLNIAGYSLSFALAATLLVAFRKSCLPRLPGLRPAALRRRFRRLPACLYLLSFCMALAGGLIYAPSNYDALCYRVPRVLQWIAEGSWHWIHTSHVAVNTRTTATEWISLPILLLTSSDRLLFLPNIISFAFLPGLVFAILSRLGISRRVSAQWMWIFPSGYCFALQAGSIGNDLIGTTLFLGGILHALKARNSMQWQDFALACIGMALATGSKASNLPLGLVWMLALFPAISLLKRFPIRCLALAPILTLISFLPTAWHNHKITGDWTGLTHEGTLLRGGDPLLYVSWNIPYLLVQNLTPPLFPFNRAWNNAVIEMTPSDLRTRLESKFEPSAAGWMAHETMMEENGPLGLGIVGLLVIGAVLGPFAQHRAGIPSQVPTKNALLWLIFSGAVVSLLPILMKSGLAGSGRYLAPHYLLLILPFLITPGLAAFMRTKLWKAGVIVCFLGLFAAMTLSAARPLWPALTVLDSIGANQSDNRLLRRAWEVYSVYRQRPEAFAPIRDQLPPEAARVGFLSANTPEASLWKPYGNRQILHIKTTDTPQSIRDRGIRYVVAGDRTMREASFPELEEWCAQNDAAVIARADFHLMVSKGLERWHILKVNTAAHTENAPSEDP